MGFGEQALLVYCATDAQTLPSALVASSYILNIFSCEQQGNINFQLVTRNYYVWSTSDHFTNWEHGPEDWFLATVHWQVTDIQAVIISIAEKLLRNSFYSKSQTSQYG